MGLLDNTTHQQYYEGNNFGNYQFTSLHDIIDYFMVVYVGENKIIPKASRVDVAFHAQRALQELSFDTFKSVKTQQIELPPTLVMPLPHDYVNYTKLMWADSAGIKHPLYPTKDTQNPFQIKQDSDGQYSFPSGEELSVNPGFDDVTGDYPDGWDRIQEGSTFQSNFKDTLGLINNKLTWSYTTENGYGGYGWGRVGLIYQQIDVSQHDFVDISADGVVADIDYTNTVSGTSGTASSYIRFGLTTTNPNDVVAATSINLNETWTHPSNGNTFYKSGLVEDSFYDLNSNSGNSFISWEDAENSTKTLEAVDVRGLNSVFVVIMSWIDATTEIDNGFALKPAGGQTVDPLVGVIAGSGNINTIDNISITHTFASTQLSANIGNELNSSTWNNYKAATPSENNNQNYEDDVYWPHDGRRYGLDPSHAQVNGSFYIDQRLGRIHFSSNCNGKTVILDYISDSLGTDGEMQVHKFAEEAMYKWITHAIISMSSYGQPLVRRLTKEKFAAVRKAKLRLSNIKLEELTQILRGKSKQIKH